MSSQLNALGKRTYAHTEKKFFFWFTHLTSQLVFFPHNLYVELTFLYKIYEVNHYNNRYIYNFNAYTNSFLSTRITRITKSKIQYCKALVEHLFVSSVCLHKFTHFKRPFGVERVNETVACFCHKICRSVTIDLDMLYRNNLKPDQIDVTYYMIFFVIF